MTIYKPYGNASYKYGDTNRLYGNGSASDDATHWIIEVDWANAGSYDGSTESAYAIGFEKVAGRKTKFETGENGEITGYKHPDVGTCRVTLDNTSRRFDPYNTSGDLYGNILPGRFIRVRVMYHGTVYDVFHGNIARITPYDTGEKNTVVLDCEDGKRWLMNGDYNSDGVITNENPANYALAVARTIYPIRLGVIADLPVLPGYELSYIWSNGRVSAMSMITDLVRAQEDKWFINETGQFEVRDYISGPGGFPDAPNQINEANTLKQIAIAQPWEEIANVRKYVSHIRTQVDNFIMWEGLEKPLIAAGGSYTFFPVATYNGETVPSLIGSATITISANTLADGSGTNLPLFVGVISGADATSCILTITNFEAVSGYVTSAKLTGTVYPSQDKVSTSEDATSIATYGRHRLTLNGRLSDDVSKYNYVGNLLGSPTIEVQMQARPDIQFSFPLFNRVAVSLPKYNIIVVLGPNRFISFVNHKWLDTSGQNVLTNIRLEEI